MVKCGRFDFQGFEAAQKELRGMRRDWAAFLQRECRKAEAMLRRILRAKSPVDTGRLRDSWQLSLSGGDGFWRLEIQNGQDYAYCVNYGQRQHRRFVPAAASKNGKGEMLSKRGVAGQYFLEEALAAFELRFWPMLEKDTKAFFKGYGF